jgi:hypothetical protein
MLAVAYALLAPPGPDDYCRAAWRGTWSGLVQQNYFHWSGRWLAVTIHGLVLPHLDLQSWRYTAFLCLWLAIAALLWFTMLSLLLGKDTALRTRLAMTLGLTAIYWAGMPSPGEQLYWFHGGVEQLLPLLSAMLCVRALAPFKAEAAPSLPIIALRSVVAMALAFATGALHELVALILFGILLVLAVLAANLRRWAHAIPYFVALLGALAGMVSNLTAPGWITRRAVDMGGGGNFIYALRLTFLDPDNSPSRWLFDTRLIALTLVLLTSAWFASVAPRWVSAAPFGVREPAKKAAAIAAITIAAIFLATLATTYSQGYRAPGRVQDMIYAVFFAGWLLTLVALAPLAKPMPSLNALAMALLALSLLTAPNTLQGAFDLKRTISESRPAQRERDRNVRAAVAAGSADIVVPYMADASRLYFWDPLSPDPTDWRNDCYARYYGARALRSAPRPRGIYPPPP